MAPIGELRHIERIAIECHQRGIALADFEAFEVAVLENEERSALVFHHGPVVGDDADALLRIAAVIDKDPDQ